MADDVIQYKDISELRRDFEGMRGKKDPSAKELHEAVQRLTDTVTGMLDIFSAATEQLKLEEREYEADSRKHEVIIGKLDKIIEQNKTIAEGMVAIVEMVKEKMVSQHEREDMIFSPREEPIYRPAPPKPFPRQQPEWPQPKQEPPQRPQPMMPAPPQMEMPQMGQMQNPIMPQDFGLQMPPMEASPSPDLPDLGFPDENLGLEEEPKKKGLFGMFKK